MKNIVLLSAGLILSLCGLSVASPAVINQNIKLKDVDRYIDISTQIIKASAKITVVNEGTAPVSEIIFMVEPEFEEKLSFVQLKETDDVYSKLSETSDVQNHKAWLIKFKTPVKKDESVKFELYYAITNGLVPHPAEITQSQIQLIKYTGNCYFYSPYNVLKTSVAFDLGTKRIEDFTKVEPVNQKDVKILYGPYENIPPFSLNKIDIHYENNSPFLVATLVERAIEVSHWGNIAVEEDITLVHTGAHLKGPFSRADNQRTEIGLSSVRGFKTSLPKLASDIYYRDEIGNISTSQVIHTAQAVDVQIQPRFPLFGGWSTQYRIGYNLPTQRHLFSYGESFLLKMNVIDRIYDDLVIDEAIVKVILPEGATNIELVTPYVVEKLPNSLHFTYLDIIGRPVITFKKSNLVGAHIDIFELRYIYPKTFMILEPLLLVISLFVFFISVIIYVRLDFSLSIDESDQKKLKLFEIINKILRVHDNRTRLYQNLEEKLSSFKFSKDVNTLNAYVKIFNNDYKNMGNQISDLIIKLKSESVEMAAKVSELQKFDNQLKDLLSQQQTLYIDKLAPGKVPKATFLELETNINKKKEACIDKIKKIIRGME